MLDKLLGQVKSKVSGGKKNSDDDENEDSLEPTEESDEETESEDESDASSDDDDDDGDVDKKLEASLEAKKKKTMMFRVVIALAIGGYLAMPYIFPENSPEQAQEAQVKPKKKKKAEENLEAKTDPKPQDQAGMNSATPPTPPVDNQANQNNQAMNNNPPVENVNVTPKDETQTPTPTVGEGTNSNVGEVGQKENEISKTIDQMVTPTEQTGETPKEEKPVDLKDKIVEEDPYVEPPDYEQKGRGLVYNCTDKYWACLEKAAYQKCNKNMKYNKKNSKAIECAVVNVYGSAEDCVLVQKYNISSNAKTDFCSGN